MLPSLGFPEASVTCFNVLREQIKERPGNWNIIHITDAPPHCDQYSFRDEECAKEKRYCKQKNYIFDYRHLGKEIKKEMKVTSLVRNSHVSYLDPKEAFAHFGSDLDHVHVPIP